MAKRFISSVVSVILLVGICVWGATPFVGLMVLLAARARLEITRAYEGMGIRPNRLLSLMGALLPAAVLVLPLPSVGEMRGTTLLVLLFLACGLIAAGVWETGLASERREIHTGQNIAYGLLCGVFVSLFGGVALLRISPWQGHRGALLPLDAGSALVLLTMACTMTGDTAAFLVGKAAGRHKLAEGLSPNKTTEGLIGGMVGSVLVGGIAGWLLLGSVVFGLLVGAAAGLLGPLGDLFTSALKREVGIKDFGALIPGHGGILDRFDSLLFTSPVVVLLAKAFGGGA